ncbi:MAG TPA: hypothetical protein VIR57_00355 [Chloroflexota bacterium]
MEMVVIGGVAAVALGVPYVTQDLDICYSPEPANVRRLIVALKAVGAHLRVARMGDHEARALPFQWDERTFRDNEMLTLQTDLGPIDLLKDIPGVGDYAAIKACSMQVNAFGLTFFALDLPGLVTNKKASGRRKDLLALPLLEATLRARELDEQQP